MAVEERNNKLRSSVSFIDSISTGLRTFTRKRHHSIPALEHENIPRNVSAFPNSVISTELTEQNNADYDIIVDDAPKTTRKKKTKLQTVMSFDLDDTQVDSSFSTEAIDIEERGTLQTSESYQKSYTLSTLRNVAFVLVGCALVVVAVVIAMNIYYRFETKEVEVLTTEVSLTTTTSYYTSTQFPSEGKYSI